jgi:hypothetical protein
LFEPLGALQKPWSVPCFAPFNTQVNFRQYRDTMKRSMWLSMMRDRLFGESRQRRFVIPEIAVRLSDGQRCR